MADFDYGPLTTYEITWMSGHIERVQAHQVTRPSKNMLGASLGVETKQNPFLRMHASIDGRWTLQLQAREEDIRTIRNVSADEPVPGGGDRG